MNVHEMTAAQLWREWRIRLFLRLLRSAFAAQARCENSIGCTETVILCEDRETFDRQFAIQARYHTDTEATVN